MNANRDKGHRFERAVRTALLPAFPTCITSRYGSKQIDDSGVDLMNTGVFKIQCKDSIKIPDYHKLLKGEANVVLHNYRGKNKRLINSVAIMKFSFWQSLKIEKSLDCVTSPFKYDYSALKSPIIHDKKQELFIIIPINTFYEIAFLHGVTTIPHNSTSDNA